MHIQETETIIMKASILYRYGVLQCCTWHCLVDLDQLVDSIDLLFVGGVKVEYFIDGYRFVNGDLMQECLSQTRRHLLSVASVVAVPAVLGLNAHRIRQI